MPGAATVAVLYPGEMGSALGKALRAEGHRVVTTLTGRGPRTRQHCQDAGLEVLDSLAAVARAADIILGVVPPGAARAVAESYACCGPLGSPPRLYVDLNSIAPGTALAIAGLLARAGVEFVDGAVHGLASQLRDRGVVYLSGPAAPRVAALFGGSVRTRVLGDVAGKASTFRMLISGLTKGVIALFLEMGLAAKRAGLLPELLACYRETYPGVMTVVERVLPTYPRHAARRGEEMRELEQTLRFLGQEPCLAEAVGRLITEMGRLGLAEEGPERGAEDWPVPEVVTAVHARGLLGLPPAGESPPGG